MNISRRLKQQQHATALAGAGILRLAQSQPDKLATSFGDLLGDGGPRTRRLMK